MAEIGGKTRTCGIIGNPVEHTMSPFIHNRLAEFMGIDMVYVPFHVQEGRLDVAVNGAYGLNILGMNVTVPYKKDVTLFLDDMDAHAKMIGSVNTLVCGENGYIGYNTDYSGLFRALKSEGISIKDEEIIVLGAGGVGRTATFLCALNGAKKVYLLNRNLEKAEAVVSEISAAVEGMTCCVEAVALSDYQKLMNGTEKRYVVLQCTSVGLSPNINDVVINDGDFYRYVKYGYDLIYAPRETKFMKLVAENGGVAYNGLKMLLYQAIDAFELWNDCKVSLENVNKVYRLLQDKVKR